MGQRPGHAQFEFTDDWFIPVAFIMLHVSNNRFMWTAFTKEGAGVSLFFFWGGGGGADGAISPGESLLKQ